ncbi:hypothetical protein ACLOJK_023776 [Asimina triloba]
MDLREPLIMVGWGLDLDHGRRIRWVGHCPVVAGIVGSCRRYLPSARPWIAAAVPSFQLGASPVAWPRHRSSCWQGAERRHRPSLTPSRCWQGAERCPDAPPAQPWKMGFFFSQICPCLRTHAVTRDEDHAAASSSPCSPPRCRTGAWLGSRRTAAMAAVPNGSDGAPNRCSGGAWDCVMLQVHTALAV